MHFRTAICQVVASIPAGWVMSYGAVARAAGWPRHARHVARALKDSPAPLPWHRVVDGRGRIPTRGLDGEEILQRLLLEEEGVTFDENGRIDMPRHAWHIDTPDRHQAMTASGVKPTGMASSKRRV